MKTFLKANILSLCLFVSCHEKTATPLTFPFKGKVVAINDGDTYKVLCNGNMQTIRLAHIDCPERKQPFAAQAKQFAADLCFGKNVLVKTDGKRDRYKRIIGEIILPDGTNVNKELVRNGFAWHYKKYSTDTVYANLEAAAHRLQVGLWADKESIAPWEWRFKRSHHLPLQ